MDFHDKSNGNDTEPEPHLEQSVRADEKSGVVTVDLESLKRFFHLTGASILYCFSAVFTVYGIVNIMGPVLASESSTVYDALPCILTLHVYELALLGVLVLIVSKKVIDDAVSVAILMALFLVGTSIALGSVADKGITICFFVGLAGVAVALGKLFAMRRFAGIRFRILSILGLAVLITCNYLGPILMSRSIAADPTQELVRRELWLFLWVTMLIGAGLVLVEAVRASRPQERQQNARAPFLQTPAMVYVLALIVVGASAVHQYSMAFIFALERVLGDFVPVIAVGTLLLLEILRHSGKRFGRAEILISCVPLAVTLLAINEKSVLASGQFAVGLICYPPVLLAFSGLAIAALAVRHRWYWLLPVVFAYGLGVVLTVGFSPQHPYDLNTRACVGTCVLALLVYGIVIWNQYVCFAGIILLCLGLARLDPFLAFAARNDLTQVGAIAGVAGFGWAVLCMVFGRHVHKVVRIVGSLCLAGLVFDYLPQHLHPRYLLALFGTGLLMTALWIRTRDTLVVSILCLPFLIRIYALAKRIAYWRFVILGFLVLAAATVVSLLKRPSGGRTGRQERERSLP
jgi:hypothetical protein